MATQDIAFNQRLFGARIANAYRRSERLVIKIRKSEDKSNTSKEAKNIAKFKTPQLKVDSDCGDFDPGTHHVIPAQDKPHIVVRKVDGKPHVGPGLRRDGRDCATMASTDRAFHNYLRSKA